eukprot:Ihof_evm1s291 gene=Ihof_evmTU1s291
MDNKNSVGGFFGFTTPTLNKGDPSFIGELEDITVEGADQLIDKDELNDETFADDLEEWSAPGERPGKTLKEVQLELEMASLKLQENKKGMLGIFGSGPSPQEQQASSILRQGSPVSAQSPMRANTPPSVNVGMQRLDPAGMMGRSNVSPHVPYPGQRNMMGHPGMYGKMAPPRGSPQANQPRGQPINHGMGMGGPGPHTMQQPQGYMGQQMGMHPSRIPTGYDNLMTQSEKDFIIRIQMAQLQANNPQIEDYYYQACNLKRMAAEGRAHSRLILAKTAHQPKRYQPEMFQNALGKLPGGSINAPKPLIDVGVTRHENTNASFTRRKLLMSVESAYKLVIAIEDLDSDIVTMPPQERQPLLSRRTEIVDVLYSNLHVPQADQAIKPTDDDTFMRFMSVGKGHRLVARVLPYFSTEQLHALLLAVMRNTLTLDQVTQDGKQMLEGIRSHVLPALVQCISSFSLTLIIAVGQVFSTNPSLTIVAFLKTKLGMGLLQAMFSKAQELLPTVDQPDLVNLWQAVVTKVGAALPGQCQALCNAHQSDNTKPLYTLLGIIFPYVPVRWKAGVKDEL